MSIKYLKITECIDNLDSDASGKHGKLLNTELYEAMLKSLNYDADITSKVVEQCLAVCGSPVYAIDLVFIKQLPDIAIDYILNFIDK